MNCLMAWHSLNFFIRFKFQLLNLNNSSVSIIQSIPYDSGIFIYFSDACQVEDDYIISCTEENGIGEYFDEHSPVIKIIDNYNKTNHNNKMIPDIIFLLAFEFPLYLSQKS